ncbi:MAG: hypothetical protein QME81_03350 [bacterium]|nr:hypothetical protein [bacterium]
MRFIVDEDLPRLTNDLLQRYKHEVVDVRDIEPKITRLQLMLVVKVCVW